MGKKKKKTGKQLKKERSLRQQHLVDYEATKEREEADRLAEQELKKQEQEEREARDATSAIEREKDPPIAPLTAEEQADLPELVVTSTKKVHRPVEDQLVEGLDQLRHSSGHQKILETNTCMACGLKQEKEHFSRIQWIRGHRMYPHRHNYEWSPRCLQCVRQDRFNASGSWAGTPKIPLQIIWERGWIEWPKGIGLPSQRVYPPWRCGRIVIGQTDAPMLLHTFDQAGHYGYSGLDEGLCGMPGCVVGANDDNTFLFTCGRCHVAKYCCIDHQRWHYRFHQQECVQLAVLSSSSLSSSS